MENLKEYLRKNNDGEYILEVTDEREAQEPHAKHWIEVPKGCDYLISVFGVNSFIDSDMFAKFKTKNVLWSRKPMKEYLIKSGDGKYLLTHHDSIGAIEIPDGATYYAKDAGLGKSGNFFFRLRSDDFDFEAVWLDSNWMQAIFNVENQDVLWRSNNNQTIASAVESSHPEELPFIDDEPLQSLNDQYAEIEKVRQTLNQRQEQYGSFEDVATATQDLLKILEKTGLKSLPSMHKEALHMICSKMVRIVNGDHNFIESWHDIAGYATLMENELRVTDGATNSRLTYQKVINGKLQDI